MNLIGFSIFTTTIPRRKLFLRCYLSLSQVIVKHKVMWRECFLMVGELRRMRGRLSTGPLGARNQTSQILRPSLSPEERLASFRPSTSRSEEEYWSDCLDIYRRLRGYVEGQEKSENYSSLNHRQRHLLHLDLEQLEHRVRQISIRFSNVVEDIERLRIFI